MRTPHLKRLRERAFLTQLALARKSGIAIATINRIERGYTEPRISTVLKLAHALDVAPGALVDSNEAEAGS